MTQKFNIRIVPIGDLVPYELNSKKHDAEQVKKIAESIRQFGWDQPIVVDSDMTIIKGHGRRLAAQSLGMTEVPVLVRSDLSAAQVRASRLADNRVAISDIDTELFRAELAHLDYDLAGIFDEKELNFSAADLGEMNTDVFIEDVDGAVEEQEIATRERIRELEDRRVAIGKALGFKDIRGSDEIVVARFIAHLEKAYPKANTEEAFIAHLKRVVEGSTIQD
jgi:hypothetical protein